MPVSLVIRTLDEEVYLKELLSAVVNQNLDGFDDAVLSQLWVTSACEGLSQEQMSLYPLFGNSLVYDLELRSY